MWTAGDEAAAGGTGCLTIRSHEKCRGCSAPGARRSRPTVRVLDHGHSSTRLMGGRGPGGSPSSCARSVDQTYIDIASRMHPIPVPAAALLPAACCLLLRDSEIIS
jgi:hypothetical protein